MLRAILLLSLVPAAGEARSSEILPTYPLRQLVVGAAQVVEARPLEGLDRKENLRFKVLTVLRGQTFKAGETVSIGRFDGYSFRLGEEFGALPGIERALLFLVAPKGAEAPASNELVLSGVRLLAKDARVLRPRQVINPGPYVFEEVRPCSWEGLLKRTRDDIKAVDEVRALFTLKDVAARNRKLFEWIESRRKEFSLRSEDPDGVQQRWFPLDYEVFGEILKSRVLEDCWRAVALHHEIHDRNPAPMAEYGSFASVEGRRFLREILRPERRTLPELRRALWLLADERTLWPSQAESQIRPEERPGIREAFEAFLSHPESELRDASFQGLVAASRKGPLPENTSTDTLPLLTRVYEKEPPGDLRNRMAAGVLRVGGPEHWKKVSGNDRGILVVINQHGLEKRTAWFGLYFESAPSESYENPVLALERLDGLGRATRLLEVRPRLLYSTSPVERGWGRSHGQARFQGALDQLEAGRWRARFRGTVGRPDDKVSWISEPVEFEVK